MKITLSALAAFASVATAHFNMNYPAARGFDEDKLVQFPCGSFDTPVSNRTVWPISNGSIALLMGHIDANVEVLIGFGNDPGSAFNTVLRPTCTEQGLGNFCMTGFSIPEGLNITDGTNATIQVVTNGDPDGGLYNCADIIFSTSAPAPADGVCKNETSTKTVAATSAKQPNETTGTTTSSSSTPSTSKSAAVAALNAGFGGLVMAGAAALAIVL
ncbi:Uncharacterized protein LSUE1_G002013 [Lachnellula suecica]|uniref:Copper acquisition factor BIM1-like domain-containing protein n=1 Tax=Lachnellula suecica TaxID=602035 RepID=A0A8T9CAJ9_9HELO|nr:Uncharacterized protein LSUE1_G002013 [Lachnellula suecica]